MWMFFVRPVGFAAAINTISSNTPTINVSEEERQRILDEENARLQQLKVENSVVNSSPYVAWWFASGQILWMCLVHYLHFFFSLSHKFFLVFNTTCVKVYWLTKSLINTPFTLYFLNYFFNDQYNLCINQHIFSNCGLRHNFVIEYCSFVRTNENYL